MPLNFVSFSAQNVDPLWSYVRLLISGDVGNGAVAFPDAKGHVVTRLGAPVGDSTRKSPGGNSIRYATKGDGLSITNSTDFDLLGNEFCIESFNQFDSGITSGAVILGRWGIGPNTAADYIFLFNGAKTEFVGGGVDLQSTAWTNDGKMHHFCVERWNGFIILYIDGVMLASTPIGANIGNSGGRALRTGVWDDGNSGYVGNQAMIRMTVGAARYKGQNFTIPKSAYPIS